MPEDVDKARDQFRTRQAAALFRTGLARKALDELDARRQTAGLEDLGAEFFPVVVRSSTPKTDVYAIGLRYETSGHRSLKVSIVGTVDRETGQRELGSAASFFTALDLEKLIELADEAARVTTPVQLERGL
jgi:hypothetical protein